MDLLRTPLLVPIGPRQLLACRTVTVTQTLTGGHGEEGQMGCGAFGCVVAVAMERDM